MVRIFQGRGAGLIPGQGTKIPHTSEPRNRNKKQYYNIFNKDLKKSPHFKKLKKTHKAHKFFLLEQWSLRLLFMSVDCVWWYSPDELGMVEVCDLASSLPRSLSRGEWGASYHAVRTPADTTWALLEASVQAFRWCSPGWHLSAAWLDSLGQNHLAKPCQDPWSTETKITNTYYLKWLNSGEIC